MFLDFFLELKKFKVPVSLDEFLSFLNALKLDLVQYNVNNFYFLAKASLIKDEKLYDRFDIIFGNYFKSIDRIELEDILHFLKVPKSWLEKVIQENFSEEEKSKIKSLGDFKELIETLKDRIKTQKKKHQGGNKWIGTAGKSPFGAYGFNPEGIRIGQSGSIQKRAVKIWEKRIFKNFDDKKQLDTRGLKIALKKLRQWSRTGLDEVFDIEETIHSTAKNGYLEIRTNKERQNNIKILLFLDVGGSMDYYIEKVENLFSAAKYTFKNLEYFYFHNCIYENVWKNNDRRWEEKISTDHILRTYSSDYKCIFVGDASMSPYEILVAGAGNEYFNKESGEIWLKKILEKWKFNLWINPTQKKYWKFSESTKIIRNIVLNKMVPLNLEGINKGIKILSKR